jgi:hypothetical protein
MNGLAMGAQGNGNLFADLGIDGADEHIAKADIASRIASIVEQSGMSEIDAMDLLRGTFRGIDLETIKRAYAALAGLAG